ncbi:oligosaccharide flippase family protein [Parahaliea maris]|uniref:Oligosaccharide flippase family protein n=1 Tax=Parahaliea maris TaxID=2716870 RepID=A0A5C9A9D9_9GAMM|nr:oligosaccharide flippase family protein [Parahaliea maris]TXS96692.1 oligosaccharide flippase family protein [Parahaliea maris]
MRRSLTLNICSSIIGRIFSVALMFIFTPIYIELLGIESYGLIGFYTTILASIAFLDQALNPLISRYFAQASNKDTPLSNLWNAFRTLEALVLFASVLLATVLALSAPWLSSNFTQGTTVSNPQSLRAIQLMGLMVAVQWPSSFYSAALSGMGEQVALNSVRVLTAVLQWFGGALVLAALSNEIQSLFLWHAACFALLSSLLRVRVKQCVQPNKTRFQWNQEVLRQSWRFSIGTLAIGFTGTLLTQSDKFLVAKFTSLSSFAAYSLSFTLASVVSVLIVQPALIVAYPHFTQLATAGMKDALAKEYRRWTQLTVFVTLPPVGALVFYGEDIAAWWLGTKGGDTPQEIGALLPWIALGTMLNVLMVLPYTLQLAHSWAKLSAYKNLLILPFFLIALWYGIPHSGPIVGAWAWLAINVLYFAFEVPIMHRRLLQHALYPWWVFDTTLPCVLGLLIFYTLNIVLYSWAGVSPLITCLASIVLVLLSTASILPACRELLHTAKRSVRY